MINTFFFRNFHSLDSGSGRVVRWCWLNFQCRGVLLISITVGQGPTALAVGAGGGCLDIFSLIYHFSFLSPSLWETARYRLKYCLKGPLSPKTTITRFFLPLLTFCCVCPTFTLTASDVITTQWQPQCVDINTMYNIS